MNQIKALPLVSVCIPMYNGGKYLLDALESTKTQTFQNIELIISDDASTDDSMKLVANFLKTFEMPFKVVSNPHKGIGSNWNNCIRNASGKYIKFLFQDDVLFPDCITSMVSMAESDPKVGMVYANRAILMDKGNLAHQDWLKANRKLNELWNRPLEAGIYQGKRLLKDKNLFLTKPYNKIGEPTVILYRKSVFELVGLFDTELIQFLDLEFSLRILPKFKFGYIDQELAGFRLHENQASYQYSRLKLNERSLFFKKLEVDVLLKLGLISKKIVAKETLPPVWVNLVKGIKSVFR